MYNRKLQILILTSLTVGFVLTGAAFSAETRRLTDDQKWEKIEDSPQGKQMLDTANIKQLAASGKPKEIRASLSKLLQSNPNLTPTDIDTYIQAEVFYAKRKWLKANRKYNDFLDNSTERSLRRAALERQFSIAVAFLNGEKKRVLKVLKLEAYEEADTILRGIADRAKDTPLAKRALLTLAKGYQKKGKYIEAYEVWADIKYEFPTGDIGQNALLQMASTMHSVYKGPNYDSSSLATAKTNYEDYIHQYGTQYSQLVAEQKINAKVAYVDQQLAYKQYTIGQYYENAENLAAANYYYRYVVADWPNSKGAELSKNRLLALESGKSVAAKKSLHRKAFDKTTWFLDNWFGLSKLKH